ncbi:MAG: ferritin family protein [Geobacter sp.]|nr:ferritin family protein [Geobacter sp.]
MNVLDCAIKMEEDAKAHYQKLASNAKVEELKKLFELMAGAEDEHLEALKKMRDTTDPAQAQFNSLNDAACAFRPLLGKRDLMAELQDDPDAFKHVVKEEEESIKFYEDLAAKADKEATRNLLLKIADQERRHLNIVENIYLFVQSPKTYLAWGEFSNLKEF